jgi:chemotaxis-related protein WspD
LLDREIPPDALQEWTEELAKPKDVEPTGQVSVVLFRLREEWLALKTIALQEVAEVRPVHSMPLRTGRVFRGIVNINGELLVCVSVADLLGLTGEATTVAERRVYPRMLVVGEAGGRFVFPVDEVLGVRKISSADLQQAPVTVSKCPTALSRGVFSLQGRWVALFDEEKFFQALNGSLIS